MTGIAFCLCICLLSAVTIDAATGGSCSDSASVLSLHNHYRSMHGAKPLVWDTSLAAKAQTWADYIVRSNGCWLTHSAWATGENLFMIYGSTSQVNAQCVPATNAWYNEVTQYRFTATPWSSNSGNFNNIRHFTQQVWKATTHLGCAVSFGPFQGYTCAVVACEFTVMGNVGSNSAFHANVGKLGEHV